jgi:hypothetical protein
MKESQREKQIKEEIGGSSANCCSVVGWVTSRRAQLTEQVECPHSPDRHLSSRSGNCFLLNELAAQTWLFCAGTTFGTKCLCWKLGFVCDVSGARSTSYFGLIPRCILWSCTASQDVTCLWRCLVWNVFLWSLLYLCKIWTQPTITSLCVRDISLNSCYKRTVQSGFLVNEFKVDSVMPTLSSL